MSFIWTPLSPNTLSVVQITTVEHGGVEPRALTSDGFTDRWLYPQPLHTPGHSADREFGYLFSDTRVSMSVAPSQDPRTLKRLKAAELLPGDLLILWEVGWSPYVPTSGLAIRLEVGSANPA